MTRLGAAVALAVALGCGGAVGGGCERTPYETERPRYRCLADGGEGARLETLTCGVWEPVDQCDAPATCTPGPKPGCR